MIEFLFRENLVCALLRRNVTFLEQSLDDILVNEEMMLGIMRAQLLHAENFSACYLINLEANGHLAALRKWAVLTLYQNIVNLLFVIKCNFEI